MDAAPTGRRRRWRRAFLLAGLVLAASLLVGAGWWLASGRLTDEERRLVGTWREVKPDPDLGPPFIDEMVLLPDRTAGWRTVHTPTGALRRDAPLLGRWRVAGGRLERPVVLNPLPAWLGGRGRLHALVGDDELAWDGPDRIALTGSPNKQPQTVTWERTR